MFPLEVFYPKVADDLPDVGKVVINCFPGILGHIRVDALHPLENDKKVVEEESRLQDVLFLITLDQRVVAGELAQLRNESDEELRDLHHCRWRPDSAAANPG